MSKHDQQGRHWSVWACNQKWKRVFFVNHLHKVQFGRTHHHRMFQMRVYERVVGKVIGATQLRLIIGHEPSKIHRSSLFLPFFGFEFLWQWSLLLIPAPLQWRNKWIRVFQSSKKLVLRERVPKTRPVCWFITLSKN